MHRSGRILRGIREAEGELKRKRERLERMEHLAEYSGIRYGDEGSGGTAGAVDRTAEIVAEIADLKDEIERDRDRLIDMRLDGMKLIEKLENGEAVSVLYMRYFQMMKWEDIAREKYRSMDWVFRIHRESLRRLDEKIM